MTTATTEATTAREALRAAEPEYASEVLAALREAAKSTKTAWVTCPDCGKRGQVEIQDAQAAIAASKALMDYAGGKPGTAEDTDHDQVIINRVVPTQQQLANAALSERPPSIAGARAGDVAA